MSASPQPAHGHASPERLTVTYRLHGDPAAAESRAWAIAYEQTCELPAALVDAALAARSAGRVESVVPAGRRHALVVVSYPAEVVGTELPQLLSVLYGNISLQPGIRIEAIAWPPALLAALGGPRHGIAGLRALAGVPRRALLSTALKPVGLSAQALAELAHAFALGGIDLIKDDHGLTDQASAPFTERLERCQEALARAAQHTGRRCLYLPNVTGPAELALRRAEQARAAGCAGVLVVPWAVGLDTVRLLRDAAGLAILAHPGLTGSYFGRDAGIRPELLLGDLYRIAGADAVIYPNTGGRFDLGAAACAAINAHLRAPLGTLKPALPAPAGGMDVACAPQWVRRYGPDTILLIGGSLYAKGNLTAAAADLRRAVEALAP